MDNINIHFISCLNILGQFSKLLNLAARNKVEGENTPQFGILWLIMYPFFCSDIQIRLYHRRFSSWHKPTFEDRTQYQSCLNYPFIHVLIRNPRHHHRCLTHHSLWILLFILFNFYFPFFFNKKLSMNGHWKLFTCELSLVVLCKVFIWSYGKLFCPFSLK